MVSLIIDDVSDGDIDSGNVGDGDVGAGVGGAVGDVGSGDVGGGDVGVGVYLSSLLLLLAVVASRSRNLTWNRFLKLQQICHQR